jgi:bromodomain-containing protein 8
MSDVYEDQPLEPSEIEAEVEIESDEPPAVSNSDPVEGETSLEDRPDMTRKEDVSIHPMSEPSVVHAVGSPLSLGGTTTSVECTRKTESEEATGIFEVKEEIQLDESRPVETQVKQDDEMEIEHENGHAAASPVAEQSRRDHKRKASEAASIFSDSVRDRKKTREDSQPVDEDEPGMMFPTFPITISQRMNRSRAPTRPPDWR